MGSPTSFPSVEHLAEIDPAHLAFPKSRQRCLATLIRALADGELALDAGCDWNRAREQLLALPGIGPWTAEVIAMRGLGDPDAFPATDLGVRLAAKQLGLPADPRPLTERSARGGPGAHMPPSICGPLSTTPSTNGRRRRSDGSTAISNRRQSGRPADPGREATGG